MLCYVNIFLVAVGVHSQIKMKSEGLFMQKGFWGDVSDGYCFFMGINMLTFGGFITLVYIVASKQTFWVG